MERVYRRTRSNSDRQIYNYSPNANEYFHRNSQFSGHRNVNTYQYNSHTFHTDENEQYDYHLILLMHVSQQQIFNQLLIYKVINDFLLKIILLHLLMVVTVGEIH